ncbi:uncharacterized protein A4U43_C07F30830 [Asparagus officinalis]|uniref:Uncharacterized protein n=1 Tax=Asparagus officinalis TaxID=4686 RepID=A0A5P1EJA3_ASPOF|nr:extra-large guanine nucleotide-binding protein 1-like [Asparagus officinalis]ONK64869.1 uncharacterized protein A4U43_C07F30830 [Asparagus officinalis]
METIMAITANSEYSFAIEYSGPLFSFDIPKASPIEIDKIPVASVATSAPALDSLPVVQPLPLKKRLPDQEQDQNLNFNFSSELKVTDSSFTSDLDEDEDLESSPSVDDGDVEENRTAVVAFGEASSSSAEDTTKRSKKGRCSRCLKGNWFTEKEACLVCDARYCIKCVMRAMGSMPEGRKCIACIGSPIEDSNREKLGKSSRMLKRLFSSLEVEQAMKAEKYCGTNQLRAEDVFVNRQQLTQEEMVLLQSCACPLLRLKPGYYWYDKMSGYWGKEGHKPDKIITANLNVGGNLMQNASNGNTGIIINNREITKDELKMLKWAGVPCAGTPHFWVDPDGSYREEGQNDIKGKLWIKASTRLLCSILSLPVPGKGANRAGEEVNNMLSAAFPNFFEHKTLQKFFLVGSDGSGTSTIFKQAKFLYEPMPFSEDERRSIKQLIQSSIYSYLGILLEGRERFEEESLAAKRNSCVSRKTGSDVSEECDGVTVYSISPRLKAFSDWLLKVMAAGNLEAIFPAATREYAPTVEELWKDAAVQATYSRRRELESLPNAASYFLQKVVDISRVEYEPSDQDILYADGITPANALTCTEFTFPQTASEGSGDDADQQDTLVRYQLIRLPSKGLGENCKWLDMFEDVRIVIFCVSLSDYDEYYEDAFGVPINKMMGSKKLFENIIANQSFEDMEFLLVLNKFDLLEEKIKSSPLTVCDWFDDFHPISSRNPNGDSSEAEKAFYYISFKFKKLFACLSRRKLYVTSTKGLEKESVDSMLRYAREILKWEEVRRPLNNHFSNFETTTTCP